MDVSQCAEYLKGWCLKIYGVRRHVREKCSLSLSLSLSIYIYIYISYDPK
jgi:hypothetical protein